MDEAVYRLSLLNCEKGIVCGFDADSVADNNYLIAIEEHFLKLPKSPGASVYFEHPIKEIIHEGLRKGITEYELHLRYLVKSIQSTGFPYAFHTVGSSFAVRADAYVKQGGMNRFKAGEDFYFLNKIIRLENYSEINTTRVIPSARISDRVPFGTGASMSKWLENNETEFYTYQLESFHPLKMLFSALGEIWENGALPLHIAQDNILNKFLEGYNPSDTIFEIRSNSSSFEAFKKRFYGWFDAFMIVKYLNYAALNGYPKKPVGIEARLLLLKYTGRNYKLSAEELLLLYRNWDRNGRPD
ncbi:MAG: hypothetical protein HC830_14275 [Bacteroidetes bacterium]|nr:hypothetical protein [Bacteroidota bacterium]